MASTKKEKGRVSGQAVRRRRFFDYPRSRVQGFRRWLPSWRVVVGTFLVGIALVIGVVVAAYVRTGIPKALPDVNQQTTTVYYNDGASVLTTWATQNRKIIDYETLPTCDGSEQSASTDPGVGQACLGNAVVASEDRTFWTNQGVDPRGIARAFVNNLRGNARQGASTLTQQYVEKYYKKVEDSYAGKFQEAILALKISQQAQENNENGQFTGKKEILGNYLNTIYFGRGAYGVEAAARAYYGVSATELNYSQAAMIAGIIPSPTNWDPVNNPEQAEARWNRTLDFMVADGYITAQQRADVGDFPMPIVPEKRNRMYGPGGYLIQMVKDELVATGQFTSDELETGGYTIETTVNRDIQLAAEQTMESLYLEQDPAPAANLEAALVSIDPADGSIRALYGGRDYLTHAYNNATLGAAQGGSTFKPFTLVGALRENHTLDEVFNGNNKLQVAGWDKPVTNFSGKSWGRINLATATARSVNTVYAQLNHQIGPEKTADVAALAGIKSEVKRNAANVLGTDTVHPLELANAYATFAAQGRKTAPHIVSTVKDPDGNVIWEAQVESAQVFEPDVMAAATYAMTRVVEDPQGSGEPAKALGRPVAGKTGTSNENKSAWFAGFVPQLATVVGIYQTGPEGQQESITPFGQWARSEITGGTWPVMAWTSFMEKALDGAPVLEFPEYTPPKSKQSQTPTDVPSEKPATTPPPSSPATPPAVVNPEVTVPNVTGQNLHAAKGQLERLGLRVAVTEEYSDYPRGTIIKVMPSGATVPLGSTVSLVVSKGPQPQPTPPPVEPENPGNGGGDPGADDGGAGGRG